MKNCRSRKFKTISNLIGYIGVSVCLICAIAYLLILELGDPTVVGVIRWEMLALLGILAVVVILVAVVFRITSNAIAQKEREAARLDAFTEGAAAEETTPAPEEAAGEATAIEEAPAEEATAVVEEPKTGMERLKAKFTPENKEKIIQTVKKNAPVIIAVAATATVCTVVAVSVHKRKKEKLRRSILEFLR